MTEAGQQPSTSTTAPIRSAAFLTACGITIDRFEGGATRVVDDGLVTRYGIAQKYHPEVDVETLTRAGAEAIYLEQYWQPFRCDALPPGVAFLVFDLAVNPGQGHAVHILQAQLRVEPDGVIGPDTLSAARDAPVLELIAGLTQRRVLWYLAETQRRPYKLKWLDGWLMRSARGAVYAARMAGSVAL